MANEVTRRSFVGTLGAALAARVTGPTDGAEPAPAGPSKAIRFEAGKNTHENLVFSCSGGLSNVGLATTLAGIEVVKELGLRKVAVGCLAGLPKGNVPGIFAKGKAARKIVTVDGCPFACARKIVEAAGLPIAKAIVLSEDVPMRKIIFHEELDGTPKDLMDYVSAQEVKRAKELIIQAIRSTS